MFCYCKKFAVCSHMSAHKVDQTDAAFFLGNPEHHWPAAVSHSSTILSQPVLKPSLHIQKINQNLQPHLVSHARRVRRLTMIPVMLLVPGLLCAYIAVSTIPVKKGASWRAAVRQPDLSRQAPRTAYLIFKGLWNVKNPGWLYTTIPHTWFLPEANEGWGACGIWPGQVGKHTPRIAALSQTHTHTQTHVFWQVLSGLFVV